MIQLTLANIDRSLVISNKPYNVRANILSCIHGTWLMVQKMLYSHAQIQYKRTYVYVMAIIYSICRFVHHTHSVNSQGSRPTRLNVLSTVNCPQDQRLKVVYTV